ncbi:MAG: 50S ribosomal protein L9 [Candidatus Omnitrophica bacterium]|nr:50S ribosomal protein L9 [Candidatus Omnitrophota bacterium]
MKVILSQSIDKLGKVGDVIKVKDGFARNFLIPQKQAYLATAQNLKRVEKQKAKHQAEALERKAQAEEFSKKLSGVSCTINVEVNDLEKLYGAISETDIAKAINDEGFDINKKDIVIEQPIEELGIFEVGVRVHPEVTAKVRVWVTKK